MPDAVWGRILRSVAGQLFMALMLALAFTFAEARAASPVLDLDVSVAEHDLTPYWETLEDPSRTLTVDRLGTARFQPPRQEANALTFGYSDSAYWFRLHVKSTQATSRLLEIAYPSLDHVELFVPDVQGRLQRFVASDRVTFAERSYPHRHFLFPVELPEGESTIYLHVVTEGTLTIPATLWTADAFHRHNPPLYALFALYYGTLLALGAYNLLLYFAIRERIYLEYVLFVLFMAVGQASLNGFGNQFAWPDWPAWGNIALPAGFSLSALFGTVFIRSFLETRTRMPLAHRFFAGMALLFAFSAAIAPWHYTASAILVSAGGLTLSITACMAALVGLRRGHSGARYLVLAWTLLLFGVGAMAARNLGWVPANFFTTYAMQIGSTLEMLLLSFALAERINAMRREKQQAVQEALDAKLRVVEAMQRNERELEERVAERTQELAKANERLRENEELLLQMARRDSLTGLANRTALDEALARAIMRAGRNGSGLAVLLIDLDGFKPINDSFGHVVGDIVLREVARRLEASIRATDLACRFGGDEFVVILEGGEAREAAVTVSEKLLEALQEPFLCEERTLHLNASIGVALYPQDGDMPWELIKHADQAMYAAKTRGGGHYRIRDGRSDIHQAANG